MTSIKRAGGRSRAQKAKKSTFQFQMYSKFSFFVLFWGTLPRNTPAILGRFELSLPHCLENPVCLRRQRQSDLNFSKSALSETKNTKQTRLREKHFSFSALFFPLQQIFFSFGYFAKFALTAQTERKTPKGERETPKKRIGILAKKNRM